jgi:hypothetical protein
MSRNLGARASVKTAGPWVRHVQTGDTLPTISDARKGPWQGKPQASPEAARKAA